MNMRRSKKETYVGIRIRHALLFLLRKFEYPSTSSRQPHVQHSQHHHRSTSLESTLSIHLLLPQAPVTSIHVNSCKLNGWVFTLIKTARARESRQPKLWHQYRLYQHEIHIRPRLVCGHRHRGRRRQQLRQSQWQWRESRT